MPSFLISLPPELLCDVVRKLPIDDGRNLLQSCSDIYNTGIYAFDRKCFSVIPLTLNHGSISRAEDLTNKQSCHFLKEIITRIDRSCNRYLGKLNLESRLLSVFTNASQVSTIFNTITIQYDPDEFDLRVGRYTDHTKVVVWVIKEFLKGRESTDFKINIQNIRLHDFATLFTLGKSFLNRVYSIGLRVEPYVTVRYVEEFLPFATNLKEISLMNDTAEKLTLNPIGKVIKAVNSKTLESIILAGVDATKDQLQEILDPLKVSLKNIKLKEVIFTRNSFKSFVRYIYQNYSVEDFYAEDIWQTDGKKKRQLVDPMLCWYSLQLSNGQIVGDLITE